MYFGEFTQELRYVFQATALRKYDLFKTMDTLLGSEVFTQIRKIKSAKFLNMTYEQLLECIYVYGGFDYKATKSKDNVYDDYIAWWCGYVLSTFFWKYRIDFTDWLKYFSSEDLYYMFYPANEASIEWTADLLYRKYIDAKEEGAFRKNKDK